MLNVIPPLGTILHDFQTVTRWVTRGLSGFVSIDHLAGDFKLTASFLSISIRQLVDVRSDLALLAVPAAAREFCDYHPISIFLAY